MVKGMRTKIKFLTALSLGHLGRIVSETKKRQSSARMHNGELTDVVGCHVLLSNGHLRMRFRHYRPLMKTHPGSRAISPVLARAPLRGRACHKREINSG